MVIAPLLVVKVNAGVGTRTPTSRRLPALGMPLTNIVAIAQPAGKLVTGAEVNELVGQFVAEQEHGLLVVQAAQLHHRIIRR